MLYFEASWWPLLLVAIAVGVLWKLSQPSAVPGKLPLPPGPTPLPIIGNLLDIPTVNMEQSFRDLNAKHGEVVHLNACGQPMVVLGTHQAALDLLEKRSANYSDRVFSTMSELTGWTFSFAIMRYSPMWRRVRRAFHEYMNINAIAQYHSVQELESRRYLLRVIERPRDFLHHGRHLFGAVILRVGYGIDVDKSDTDYLAIAEEAMSIFSLVFLPGKYLVETFPILRHLPSFFPGARFKREAAEWYPLVRKMVDVPWDAAVDALRNGRDVPSMFSSLRERTSSLQGAAAKEEEEVSKSAIANVYAGGADTTLSALQSFYLAMASYPEVQKRAQDELDTIIGPDRLPTMNDAQDLPYVNAVIKECLRWRPVVPLSLMHLSLEEDEYKGYRIPKGSAVVSNPWAYARDPANYPDPETFNPERFLEDGKLNPNILDPTTMVFGYGRRICPGRHFAQAAIFAVVSAALHTLSIAPPLDKDGNAVHLLDTVKMSHGVISYPEEFECIIKPRSAEAEALVRASCGEDGEKINM